MSRVLIVDAGEAGALLANRLSEHGLRADIRDLTGDDVALFGDMPGRAFDHGPPTDDLLDLMPLRVGIDTLGELNERRSSRGRRKRAAKLKHKSRARL